jgi:hypothetical protein
VGSVPSRGQNAPEIESPPILDWLRALFCTDKVLLRRDNRCR